MSYPYQIKSLEAYREAYKKSIDNPAKFWLSVAQNFVWKKAPKQDDELLKWNFEEPNIAWFKDSKLNITENCLDRHLAGDAATPAIIWEPNNPKDANRVISYRELHFLVCQFAQVLDNIGVQKGDRVIIYMGMVPEAAIAMLACARVGAIHSVVFGGFSAQSIKDRILDAQASFCDYTRWSL
jgi:acetyl-CoA synthetase